MSYSPLHIPKKHRDLRMGCYVVCHKNGSKKVRDKCCISGKKIQTCKHGESHRFQSKVKSPTGTGFKQKNWPQSLRDLREFFKLHLQFIETIHTGDVKPIDTKPGLLGDCLLYYADFINDVGVPSYEKKNNSEKYVKNQVANLKHIFIAFREKGIEPKHLPITEFGQHHVAIIHDYLEREFANKTYNDKIATYQAFFKFLINKGYSVKNNFEDIRKKHTEARKDTLDLEQFSSLCKIATSQNGVKFEKKGNGRVSKVNMYRDWLVDGWEYALFSGCRRSEIQEVKMTDIKDDHIFCRNDKVSNLTKSEVIRMIPIPKELRQFINRVSADRKPNDYLIAPKEKNRRRVGELLSKAFSHYWSQLGYERRILNDLRNTYSTAMVLKYGAMMSGKIGIHQDTATTIEHYENEKTAIDHALKQMNGKSIY